MRPFPVLDEITDWIDPMEVILAAVSSGVHYLVRSRHTFLNSSPSPDSDILFTLSSAMFSEYCRGQ